MTSTIGALEPNRKVFLIRAPVRLLQAVANFAREYRHVLIVFAASRLFIFAVILLSQLVLVRGIYWHANGLLPVLLNWDGERWYLDIVRHGYFFDAARPSNVAFFPFYPLLVKIVSFFIHDVRIAGVLTANACLLLAGILLHRLVKLEHHDQRSANIAVTFLMFSPVSFFSSSAHVESTFLLLALLSMWAAIQQRWLLACLAAMCLSATRNVGVWMTVALFVEYVRQASRPSFNFRRLLHPRILLLALAPAGLGFYMLFLYWQFGDPLAFLRAEEYWGRQLATPVQTFATILSGPWQADTANDPFHRLISLSGLAAALLVWLAGLKMRIRPSYLVFAALLIATCLCSNTLEAMPRYLSVVFPLFIVLGLLTTRFPRIYEPALALSIGLLALLTTLEANGYWIT